MLQNDIQDAGAFRGRVIVAAPGDERPKTQRGHGGQSTGVGGVERGQHFVEPEKGFENEEIHARVFEEANLLGHEVFGMTQRAWPLALDELCA